MTRKSERELERVVEDLDGGGGDDQETPATVRIRRKRVDQDGTVVEPHSEEVIECDYCGPDLLVNETVVETGWEPE